MAGQELVQLPSGEALVLSGADAELAQGLDTIQRMVERLGDAQEQVAHEILGRMDKRLRWSGKDWTFRVGDVEYTLASQSPDAGATAYRDDVLAEQLAPLVEDGTLSQEAVDRVLVRTVTASVTGEHCDSFKRAAARYGANVSDVTKVAASGIKALEKLNNPAVDAAIEEARTVTPPAKRRVKLSVNEKKGAG